MGEYAFCSLRRLRLYSDSAAALPRVYFASGASSSSLGRAFAMSSSLAACLVWHFQSHSTGYSWCKGPSRSRMSKPYDKNVASLSKICCGSFHNGVLVTFNHYVVAPQSLLRYTAVPRPTNNHDCMLALKLSLESSRGRAESRFVKVVILLLIVDSMRIGC